jgi:two-component sensor histidine kinase
VHETLSHEAGDDVPFIEIVRPLVRMVEEGLVSPDNPVAFRVSGDAGKLPATMATPLAVVLTEALQNVVDHAYPPSLDLGSGGRVEVDLENNGRELRVRVVDDGVGLPPGFSIESTTGLGLSIVRTLVTTELAGTIELYLGDGPSGRPGTVVDIQVPLAASGLDAERPPTGGGR